MGSAGSPCAARRIDRCCSSATVLADAGTERATACLQSMTGSERVVYDDDGARVVRILDMQRFVGLLRTEIGAGRIEVIVVQVPVQRRPGVVEHPVNDAR